MKSYRASDEPCFSSSISVVEPTDPAHADVINAAPKQLLENTAANRNEITGLKEKSLEKTGDSAENIVTFESGDGEDATSWTDVPVMESKEKHKSLLAKISTMFKNVRFLYKLLGNEDISQIADGTVTGVLQEFKEGKVNITAILKTMEQVDANTSEENIVNALAFKALKMDLMNSINQISSNLNAIFSQSAYRHIKFLGQLYLPDDKLDKISEIFTADDTTIYMFINFYYGRQVILGYCYGGEEQDKYGAQLMLRSFPLEFSALRARSLWEGAWGDWKDI